MPKLALAAVAATLALGVLVMVLTVLGVMRRDSAGGRLHPWRLAVGAFTYAAVVSGVLVIAMYAFPQPPKTVRALYARAIETNDRDAAWGLLCSVDRNRVTRQAFDEALSRALADLGGGIEDANPTRAAYEWTGLNGKRIYLQLQTSGGARPCLHLGANPLGQEPS